jgi:hypothetical protein
MQLAKSLESLQQTKNKITRLSLSLALVLGLMHCSLSAQAESLPTTPPAAEPSTTVQKTSQSSTQNKSPITHIPITLASFVVGTFVGTPIALVRCTHTELKKRTKEAYDLGGVRPKPLAYLSAGFFGIPSGLLSGVWSGALNGVSDSWRNSKDAPFSKDSFSLEKLELYK